MDHVAETKALRRDLNDHLQHLQASERQSRPRSIAITKLEEAVMWLGKDLSEQGQADPYPASRDPASPVIEPTADVPPPLHSQF